MTPWLAAAALVALGLGLAVLRTVVSLAARRGSAESELERADRLRSEAERALDILAQAPPDDEELLDSWARRMRDHTPGG
jgi:hypothetical protein